MRPRVAAWLPLIVLGVTLNVSAQISLKYAALPLKEMELSLANAGAVATTLLAGGFVWLGFLLYAVSVINWIIVLSRVDVSAAYPLVSLGYIVSAIWGYYGFGEAITPWRIAGIALIILGTFCISRT
jgi:drug/metabolite transporter (DMT)-like permease